MHQINNQDKNSLEHYKKYFEDLKNKNSNICPPANLLSDYYEKRLNKKQMHVIEEHVNICPLCLAALESLIEAEDKKQEEMLIPEKWHESEQAINKQFYTYLESVSAQRTQVKKVPMFNDKYEKLKYISRTFWDSFLNSPKLAYASTFAILIIVGLYSYAYFSRPDYFNLAQIKPADPTILRSITTTTTHLTEGLKLFELGKFQEAITKLELCLKENSDSYPANYYLGLSHLFAAKKSLLGFPYKYEAAQVIEGIKYLNNALDMSIDNQFYRENCYWYLGKAYLMSGEAMKAEEQFKKIVELDHPNLVRKVDARDIILKIKEISADKN